MNNALLEFRDFTLCLDASGDTLLHPVSLSLAPGERLALVGESGSGKSLLARSALGLLPRGITQAGGSVRYRGESISNQSARALRALRGQQIGLIFQEPLTALNPALRIGRQLTEGLSGLPPRERLQRSIGMLERVKIPRPEQVMSAYPHQLSGGMRQRVMLAAVMLPSPALLIADEPTTALDVIIQDEVMRLMLQLTEERGTALLFITHDIGLVARHAQRIAVMERGHLRESGSTDTILHRPRHAYTRQLIASARHQQQRPGPREDRDTLLKVEKLQVDFSGRRRWPWSPVMRHRAVDNIDLELQRGRTLTVIGESGSGKTTLARAIVGLQAINGGTIRFSGQELGRERPSDFNRRRIQYVFQDPFSSLDPRMRVGDLVGEGLLRLDRAQRDQRVAEALNDVGLGQEFAQRLPHQLSGGQRQRVGIARAIILRPELIIADEPVAALDVTIQQQILSLFSRLQDRYQFSYLFISHDLGMVEQVSDEVLVMFRGRMLEHAPVEAFFRRPLHPYSCRLLNATPKIDCNATHPAYRPIELPGDLRFEDGVSDHGTRECWRVEQSQIAVRRISRD